MNALTSLLPIYLLLFVFYGVKNFRRYLLLTGILALPFRTTYAFMYVRHFGWAGGFEISISDISFGLLFLCMVLTRKGRFRLRSRSTVAIVTFVLACCLSVINSSGGMYTLFGVFMIWKTAFLYFFVFINAIETEEDLQSVVLFFTISLLFQSSLACIQFFTGKGLDLFVTGQASDKLMVYDEGLIKRVFGTVGKPNGFGEYIAGVVLLNISVYVSKAGRRKIRLGSILLGLVALIFSFSRGSWLGFCVGMLAFLLIALKRNIIGGKTLAKIFVLGLILVVMLWPRINERLYGNDYNAAESRIPLIELAYNIIKAHPVIGVGVNTYSLIMKKYVTPDLRGKYIYEVHNMYLLVFAEAGIIGLICFLWILKSFFQDSLACFYEGESEFIRFVGLGVFMFLIEACTHMMVDLYNSTLTLGLLFLMAGMCASAERLRKERLALGIGEDAVLQVDNGPFRNRVPEMAHQI